MQIRIELQPLKGKQKTRFGEIEVEHDVLTILGHVVTDDGHKVLVEVGQVSTTPGRPVTFRRDVTGHPFPEEIKRAAIQAVEEFHQQRVVRTSEQPVFGEAANTLDDDQEYDEDDTELDERVD